MAVYKSNIPIAVVNVSCNVTPNYYLISNLLLPNTFKTYWIVSKQTRQGVLLLCFAFSLSLALFYYFPPLWQKHDHWKGKCISSAWSDRVACVCTARWIIAAWNRIICLKQGTGSRRICKDWKHTGESCRVESSAVGLTSLRGSLSMGVIAPPCKSKGVRLLNSGQHRGKVLLSAKG